MFHLNEKLFDLRLRVPRTNVVLSNLTDLFFFHSIQVFDDVDVGLSGDG